MNPNVYSKKRKALLDNAPQPPVPAQDSLVKLILSAPLSSVLAFALVLFAAGSVASMTAITYPEIAMGSDAVTVHVASAHPKQGASLVLGDSTTVSVAPAIDDSSMEAPDPSASLSFKPVSFNSNGRWDYKIAYSGNGLDGSGSITIGKFVLVQNLTGSGSVDTGAILKPGITYRVSYWQTDSSGVKTKLASQPLRTYKGTGKIEPCKDNSLLCPPIIPKPIPCSPNSTSTPGTMGINCLPRPCVTNSTGTPGDSSIMVHCLPLPLPCNSDKGSQHPCLPPVVCPLGQDCPPPATSTSPSNVRS